MSWSNQIVTLDFIYMTFCEFLNLATRSDVLSSCFLTDNTWCWRSALCWFTLVVQVARSGSTSRSSLCRTALGHRDESRANIRNVSIWKHEHRVGSVWTLSLSCTGRVFYVYWACTGVCRDLDVVMVLEAVLYVVQEGEDVDSVQAAVQQSVHALERSLPQVQPVVHRVFEGTHLHLQTDRGQRSNTCDPFPAFWPSRVSGCSHLSD